MGDFPEWRSFFEKLCHPTEDEKTELITPFSMGGAMNIMMCVGEKGGMYKVIIVPADVLAPLGLGHQQAQWWLQS